jgi:hypothetical protein
MYTMCIYFWIALCVTTVFLCVNFGCTVHRFLYLYNIFHNLQSFWLTLDPGNAMHCNVKGVNMKICNSMKHKRLRIADSDVKSEQIVFEQWTPWSRVLLEILLDAQLVKEFCMEPIGSLPSSQEPPTGLTEGLINSVHNFSSCFLKIKFNSIIQSVLRSSKWSLSLRFSNQIWQHKGFLLVDCARSAFTFHNDE